jgi:hypothetical protein
MRSLRFCPYFNSIEGMVGSEKSKIGEVKSAKKSSWRIEIRTA